ncbi:hypothetical protein BDR04DRAFT_1128231 [Suillus decipiens]|nr:hypothetical protein BDR04DRAFT_1128231 [Suillus decipiens]
MVLKVLAAAVNVMLPSKCYAHAFSSILAIVVVRAFVQGRTTKCERDIHAEVVPLTGGFTLLGLTLMQNLAQRSAHIIALLPKPVQDPKNDQIFADECNLTSASSVHSFCFRFLTVKETGLDAIIFDPAVLTQERQRASLASFLMLTLLPVLLVAPTKRDISIINVRVLHALPTAKRCNSIVVSACPGHSGSDIIPPPLNAVQGQNQSMSSIVLHILLQPFLHLVTKSTSSAIQSVFHSNVRQGTDAPEEVLKAGALYCKCAVVDLRMPSPATADTADVQLSDDGEFWGVHLSQAVWEGLEGTLKEWEKFDPQGDKKASCDNGLSVDTPSS